MTFRRQKLLDFIASHWQRYGYGPTFQELVRETRLPHQRARKAVDGLIASGLLARGPAYSARSLRVAA